MEELKCPICGEPSYKYYGNARKDRLCTKHAQDLKAGLIVQCEKCGQWHKSDTPCPNCQPPKTSISQTKESTELPKITCLICGKDSNGKHFCLDCFKQYHKKELLIKIVKCASPCEEIISESYESIYVCEDGHVVKSHVERDIDNWLHKRHIIHGYEKELYVGEEKPIKPDFCLIDYMGTDNDVYIEYFGLKGNKEYDEQTKYKIKKYRENHVTVVCMYPSDDKNISFALQSKLDRNKIIIGEINYFEK